MKENPFELLGILIVMAIFVNSFIKGVKGFKNAIEFMRETSAQ